MANSAKQWIEVIDRGTLTANVNRKAIKRMKEAAVDVIQDGADPFRDLYIFSDGSALYEKRKDDWYPADEETIARAQENN